MDGPVAVFKKRPAKKNLRQKAPSPPRSPSHSDSGSSSGDEPTLKKRKIAGKTITASTSDSKPKNEVETVTKFAADRTATIEKYQDATKQSNWYEENRGDDLDSKSLLGSTRTISTKPKSFIERNRNAPDRKMGPQKASTNVRTITITDYNPEVCKDYKQTGFCGFGDSCKFLHAREDYAQGWKLDREWEIANKNGKAPSGTVVASANREKPMTREEEEEAAMLEKIPFACIICKKPYQNPVKTRCDHYFCQACALKRVKKDPSCAQCGAGTSGVFNGARNLQKLLDKKKAREERIAKEKEEKGEA